MHQVADALDELEVVDGNEREALLENLREVLGALDGVTVESVQINALQMFPATAPLEPPDIAVLEGGRSADDLEGASTATQRGALRLAPDEDRTGEAPGNSSGHDDDTAGALADLLPGMAHRRVSVSSRRPEPTLGEPPGNLSLLPEPGVAAEQTVFLGETARAYRLRVLRGVLTVRVDAHAPLELRPGQTVDVEGRNLRVSALEPAEGRYIRLRSQSPL